MPSRFFNPIEEQTGTPIRYLGVQRELSHEDHEDKALRSEYVELFRHFVETLTNLSLELKGITHTDIKV